MKNHANQLEIKKHESKLKMELNGYYGMKVNSKAFAAPILSAIR